MPILKNQVVFAIVRDIKAFLNLEAGITRSNVPEPEWAASSQREYTAKARESGKLRKQSARLKHFRQQLMNKDHEIDELRSRLTETYENSSEAKDIRPEDMIWIFGYGHGRCGTTWLSSMMRNLKGYSVWVAPMVGKLFGHFYYSHAIDDRVIGWERQRAPFILGDQNETWLEPMRSFILDNAAAKFPQAGPPGHLVIWLSTKRTAPRGRL